MGDKAFFPISSLFFMRWRRMELVERVFPLMFKHVDLATAPIVAIALRSDILKRSNTDVISGVKSE